MHVLSYPQNDVYYYEEFNLYHEYKYECLRAVLHIVLSPTLISLVLIM